MSRNLRFANAPIGWWGAPRDFTTTNDLGVYTLDATQRYVFGTPLMTWDGKIYRYAKAGGTLDVDMGAKAYATQNLAYAAAASTQLAGDRQVTATFAVTDGYANSGLVLEDELAGGEIVVFSDTVVTQRRTIVGNTSVVVGGGTGIIYVDTPWQAAIAVSGSYIEAMGSQFLDVRTADDQTKCVVGVPCAIATTTYPFCWLQTRGKCWVAPQSTVGNSASIRACYWRSDGSLDIRALAGTFHDVYVTDQYAGYVLQNAQAGTQGAPFFFLECE
jgi:hypothetical protein